MATYTLTPSRIWQVENGRITGVGLSKYKIRPNNNINYKALLEFDLDSSKAYYYGLMTSGRVDIKYCYGDTPYTEYNSVSYGFDVNAKLLNGINEELYVGKEINESDYRLISVDYFDCVSPNSNESSTSFSYANYYNIISNLETDKIYILVEVYKNRYVYSIRNDITFKIDYNTITGVGSIIINPFDSFLDVTKNNTFLLNVNPEVKSFHTINIDGGTYYYKTESESNYRSVSFTGQSFTISSGVLTQNNIYNIYASCDLGNGVSANSSIGNYTTTDIKGSVTNASPVNTITNGIVNFSWNYSSPTGTSQYAFDLDLSIDEGISWTNVANHVVQTETTTILNVDTSGTVYWRVRVYNQSNIVSDYSNPTMFLNVLPPRTPVIQNVESASKPIINWNSEDQTAFQIIAIDDEDNIVYDTGFIYSTENTYKFSEYLENGLYIFKLRTVNSYGMYSDFAEYNYLQNIIINTPSVNYEITAEGALFNTDSTGFERILVKKNNILIGEFENDLFLDKFVSSGINKYTFIFINSNDQAGFYKLDIDYKVDFNNAGLVDLEGNFYRINKRWNNRIIFQKQIKSDSESVNYLGAKTPEINTTDLLIRTFNVSVFDENNSIESLIGKTLFYRNINVSCFVVLTALSRSDSWYGNEVSLNLEETQFEAINYEI